MYAFIEIWARPDCEPLLDASKLFRVLLNHGAPTTLPEYPSRPHLWMPTGPFLVWILHHFSMELGSRPEPHIDTALFIDIALANGGAALDELLTLSRTQYDIRHVSDFLMSAERDGVHLARLGQFLSEITVVATSVEPRMANLCAHCDTQLMAIPPLQHNRVSRDALVELGSIAHRRRTMNQ